MGAISKRNVYYLDLFKFLSKIEEDFLGSIFKHFWKIGSEPKLNVTSFNFWIEGNKKI